jgi:predicted DNA-binding protein (MmcQ/YjbR family)
MMSKKGRMTATTTRDRLVRLGEICLALPAVTREDKGDHASFLVANKVFAYSLNNHHGDKIISVCCKVLPDDNKRLVEGNPRKFYMPAYIGPRGWVGLRLDLVTVDWTEVKELVLGSYSQVAPQKFLKLL